MITYEKIKADIQDYYYKLRAIDIFTPHGRKIDIQSEPKAEFKRGKLIYIKDLDALISRIQKESGYPELVIKYYYANGSSWKNPEQITVDLLQAEQTNETKPNPPMQPNQIPQPTQQIDPYQNMLIPAAGMNGIGMNEAQMSAIVKIKQYDEVKAERDHLKQKYETCSEELRDLKMELRFIKFEQNKKSFLENPGVQKLMESLPDVIASAADKANSGGMNMPENPALQAYCQKIAKLPAENIADLDTIYTLLTTNQEFYDELTILLKKHNINEPS